MRWNAGARSDPHRQWWQQFLRDTGGTGFWHEAYFMRGGMEAVYNDILQDIIHGSHRFGRLRGAVYRQKSSRTNR